LITDIDLAIVWPADRLRTREKPTTVDRPLTRFVYWLSHGVPTIAFNYTAYREVAEKHSYSINEENSPPLVVDTIEELERSAKVIMASSEARLRLRAKGLRIARSYTIDATSTRLLKILNIAYASYKKNTA
jgi:glycosyltransferase involved in cell wall biosynthesis